MFTVNTSNDKLVTEFRRVFGECYVHDDGGLFAGDWTESVQYDASKAVDVLRQYRDGFGETEKGDAVVCAALEAAGAVMSLPGEITIAMEGADVGDWGTESAEDVLGRYAAFVADRTGCVVSVEGSRTTCTNTTWEPVDIEQTLWEEFCSGHNDAEFLAKYGPDAA